MLFDTKWVFESCSSIFFSFFGSCFYNAVRKKTREREGAGDEKYFMFQKNVFKLSSYFGLPRHISLTF